MKYRFVQMTRAGMWVSPGVFDDPIETIAANVARGHVRGHQRAAVSVEGDRVIFALDPEGRIMHPENFRLDRPKTA